MPLLPPNRNFQGVLLPNAFGEKYHTVFKAGNRREIIKPLNTIGNSYLNFIGAFKLSPNTYGDGAALFANGVMTYNQENNSIFIVGHDHYQSIAEFAIPQALGSMPDLSDAPTVAPVQNFHRPYVGERDGYHKISGLFCIDDKLIINWFKFYDQNGADTMINTTQILNGASNLSISTLSSRTEVNGRQKSAGWISRVPAQDREKVGGEFISGWTSSTLRAGVHVSSMGPAAYAVDYEALVANPDIPLVPSIPLVWYNLFNLPRPQGYEGGLDSWLYNRYFDNETWTHVSECSYGMVIPNSNKYMTFGHTGGIINSIGYGEPPYGGSKGHYTYDEDDSGAAYWIYDLSEMEQAKDGIKNPNHILPESSGWLDIPINPIKLSGLSVRGGGYDEANNVLYLSVNGAMPDGNPVICAFSVGV